MVAGLTVEQQSLMKSVCGGMGLQVTFCTVSHNLQSHIYENGADTHTNRKAATDLQRGASPLYEHLSCAINGQGPPTDSVSPQLKMKVKNKTNPGRQNTLPIK